MGEVPQFRAGEVAIAGAPEFQLRAEAKQLLVI